MAFGRGQRKSLVLACCIAACSDQSDDGGASSSQQAIVNGDVQPDAPGSGVVCIMSAGFGSSGISIQGGTGTLLDAQWVLTAAHVVYNAAAPSRVTVRRGNLGDTTAEVRHGKRIDIHPGFVYVPAPGGNPNFSVDVALIQLDSPIEAGHGCAPARIPPERRFDGSALQSGIIRYTIEIGFPPRSISTSITSALRTFP